MSRVTAAEEWNKMISGIYKISNKTTGRMYIGSAVNLSTRFRDHLNSLKVKKHYNQHLQRTWNKYGESDFQFIVMLYCGSEDLLFYEQRAIDVNIGNLFNMCMVAGSPLGTNHTLAAKKKISISKTGVSLSIRHKENIAKSMIGKNQGQKYTDEQRRLNSEAHKGSIPWNKGLTGIYSQETREKMGADKKGKSAWNKGKTGVYSEETLVKMSQANKRRVVSDETREKLSHAAKAQWKRQKELLKEGLCAHQLQK